MTIRNALLALALPIAAGCTTTVAPPSPQDSFFGRLSALCGSTLDGRMASSDPQDSDISGKPMTASFGPCAPGEVRINFAVGDDRSRNWVVTRTSEGIRLKHVHLHEDGSEDELSRYGGDTASAGTDRRQEFPADEFSKDLFTRKAIPQSIPNVWALEAAPGFFAYELRRPGRFFRVEFGPRRAPAAGAPNMLAPLARQAYIRNLSSTS